MAISFDHSIIHGGSCEMLADHFRDLLKDYPEQEISVHLFDLAQKEAVSPVALDVWLSFATSPKTLLAALKQEFSVFLRLRAIRQFVQFWSGPRWKDFWKMIGGIPGVLSLLEQFSVQEVEKFFTGMRWHTNDPERRELMTQLQQALLPLKYPYSSYKNTDERPIYGFYHLFPACDEEFVKNNFIDDKGDYLEDRLIEKLYRIFQNYCLDIKNWKDEMPTPRLSKLFKSLAQNIPPLPSTIPLPGFSESMRFSFDLLTLLLKQDEIKIVRTNAVRREIINPLLRRAWNKRRNIGWDKLDEIIRLCLQFVERWPEVVTQLTDDDQKSGLLYYLVLSWAYSPSTITSFNDHLVGILKKLPVGFDRQFWNIVDEDFKWVRRWHRYSLLKLFFLHLGPRSIDIENEEDLKSLDVGLWPPKIFLDMEQKDGLQLLQRVVGAKGDGFLDHYSGIKSIFSWSVGNDLPLLLGVLGDPLGRFQFGIFTLSNDARRQERIRKVHDTIATN
jgi:hypothetical protein